MKDTRQCVALALSALFAAAALAHDEHHQLAKGRDHGTAAETAFGRPADPTKPARTILVEANDSYRFAPDAISVRQGEVVRFVVVNAGADTHEMVLGTMKELREHAEMMKKQGARMEHEDEPSIAHVAPGNSGVIGWQFTKAGEFYFACLVDDHFERGMIGKVTVTP